MRIYVDVDDVLAQTTSAACELQARRSGRPVRLEDVHTFDLGVSFGLGPAELEALFDVIHSDDFLFGLDPMPGAAQMLDHWARRGFEIVVLTGRPATTEACTAEWLARHEMAHHEFACVDKYGRGGGGLRLDQVREQQFALAIEDSPDMAADLARHCADRVLLFDRPWNRALASAPGIERVTSWQEIGARL